MTIKHTNTFHFKTIQNLPKIVILVWKYLSHLATLFQNPNHSRSYFLCFLTQLVLRNNAPNRLSQNRLTCSKEFNTEILDLEDVCWKKRAIFFGWSPPYFVKWREVL
jgi:hypothetical protein